MLMKKLNIKEINELLEQLYLLKDKYNNYKCKSNLLRYNNHLNVCAKKLDYLVTNKAFKYKNYSNYEDLLQEGRIALLMSLETYKGEKGNFFAWSKQYITTRLSRKANKHSTITIPLDKAKNFKPFKISLSDGSASLDVHDQNRNKNSLHTPLLIDSTLNPYETLEVKEIKNIINVAINKLSIEEKNIIELNSLKSYSINEISNILKIPKIGR